MTDIVPIGGSYYDSGDTEPSGKLWSGNADTNPPSAGGGPSPPSSTPVIFDVVNAGATAFLLGSPVCSLRENGNASVAGKSRIIGLCIAAAAPGNTGQVQSDGSVTLATVDWDFVTGQVGGLTDKALYYLDVVAGKLTKIPPSTPGQCVVLIGSAISPDTLVMSGPFLSVLL